MSSGPAACPPAAAASPSETATVMQAQRASGAVEPAPRELDLAATENPLSHSKPCGRRRHLRERSSMEERVRFRGFRWKYEGQAETFTILDVF